MQSGRGQRGWKVERGSLSFPLENMGRALGGIAAMSRKSVAGFVSAAVEKHDWDGSSPVIPN